MILALALGITLSAQVTPSNVVLGPCDDDGFALRIDAPSLGADTRSELVNQLGIGLVSRGYALCVSSTPSPDRAISIAERGAWLDLLVRDGDRQVRRSMAPEKRDSRATGLTMAMALEELVIVVTDPDQPAEHAPLPTVPQATPETSKPARPRPFLRLGAEVQGVTYADTGIGFGVAVRADHEPIERLRLGLQLGVRQVDSDAIDAGSVRYRTAEAQASAHGVVARGEHFAFALGAAIAGGVAQGQGQAEPGFLSASTTKGIAIARALVDVEAYPSDRQTLALRIGAGRPIQGLSARTEAGQPLGGLAEWEISLGVAWLWSFF